MRKCILVPFRTVNFHYRLTLMRRSIYMVFVLFLAQCASKPSIREEETAKTALLCGTVPISLSDIDKLPTPKQWSNIGNSHLVLQNSSTEAQEWFDQGLNMLHSFFHLEAYRAFQQVIRTDASQPMGYWGIAMCQPGFGSVENPLWKNNIQKAFELRSKATPFQQQLIEASYMLINQGIDAAQMPFRNLYKNFPAEPEAVAFAAIILRQKGDEKTLAEIKEWLEKALVQFPDNVGLMHYYVHVMELMPTAAQAIPVAEKMKKLAADAPHLLHMPGHLYYLSGDYDKAVKTYEYAKTKELAYHKAENIPLSANQNYIHNLQFIAVAQAELGDYEATMKTAKEIAYLNLSAEMPNEGAIQVMLYEVRILPALVAIRYNRWQDAIKELSFWLNTPDVPIKKPMVRLYLEAMLAYTKGMNAIYPTNGGNLRVEGMEEAIRHGQELGQLMQQFEQQANTQQNSPEWQIINETFDIMSMARYELAGWIDNLNPRQPFNDTAWKEAYSLESAIRYDEPPRLMYPIAESEGRLHLLRGEKTEAQKAFDKALQKRPKSPMIFKLKKKEI